MRPWGITVGSTALPNPVDSLRKPLDSSHGLVTASSAVSRALANPIGQRCEAFSPAFRYHWLYASGAIIDSYYEPLMRAEALHRFHTGGSSVFRNQTLLPPSKLGGELEPNAFAGSYQLLPPSGRARTEGVS